MNKILKVAGKIMLGVCTYGVINKTYDWGKEYIKEDINTITNFAKSIKNSLNKKEA